MEAMTRKLMEEFTGNYFEKLFYFCLKKTGDSNEAEELTSDITLNIIAALQKGIVPVSFSGWVWQIARNRYSAWADRKRKVRETDIGSDISEIELADEKTDVEGSWFHNEDLRLLRRELSFITSAYRNIIVAYYIEDKSIRDIGHMLGLPDGTVKSKLFRAREMLKEGMKMAREFGVMSYRPEKVGFICSCSAFGKSGEPWSYLNRLLCKNILLAAYRTPSTAEELAVEIGVALPYMEDELKQLTEGTLLRKNGKRYETSFFIISARAQDKIYSHLKGLTPELTESIIEALEYKVICLDKNDVRWHEEYQPYEDMKWTLLMKETDKISEGVIKDARISVRGSGEKPGYTLRPNGGKWDIAGFEEYEGEVPEQVGEHGSREQKALSEEGILFGQYRFAWQGICRKTPDWLNFEEIHTLGRMARKEKDGLPGEILDRLQELGYVKKTEQGFSPAIMVTREPSVISRDTDSVSRLTGEQAAEYEKLRKKAKDIAGRQYEFARKVIYEEVPEFLKEDFYQIDFAVENLFCLRGAVLEEALRRGYLAYDPADDRRMLGVYMAVNS